MCGIAGFWQFAGGNPGEMRERVTRMSTCLRHRGPDDEGVFVDPVGVALGFRRLAIVDLSPAGAQPMTSASGRYVIIFNGEIYNFQRLRPRVTANWRGHSDTEVLLACIEAWGLERALAECIGMYAFALWDAQEQTLSLVRDRAGVKPLYYALGRNELQFASELKALTIDRTIDDEAAALYRRNRYIPAPYSIYRSAKKLLPGSILTVRKDGSSTLTRYWNASEVIAQVPRFKGTEHEAIDALDALLGDSVALRMIADVPLGVFLSGGVDSSLVAALMQRNASGPIHTFTIGFEDPRFDEARYGREVAQHLGSHHDELYVTQADALALIPKLPSIYDEPFADSSALPTYLVSRLARQSATVALSGDGGDELFAGYHHHFLGARLHRRVSRVPRFARGAVGRALQLVPRTRNLGRGLVENDPLARYRDTMRRYPELPRLAHPTETAMLVDFLTYLPDDILVKVDRASMAVSLEAREPFLDHRVIELAWSLPLSMKIRDDKGKWIARALLKRYLPAALVDREKQGFGIPLAAWLRGPLREWAGDLLANTPARDLWQQHLAGANHEGELWGALMFEAWRRR